MKDFFKLLGFLGNYKLFVSLNILSNILMAVFMVVSIPAVIPFFQILFDRTPAVMEAVPFSINTLEPWIQYQFSRLLTTYSKNQALIIVCAAIVSLFFFKNLFRYLSMFFMAYVRNGIVRDIRRQLFSKFLDLPFSYFSSERKGDLLSRVSNDVVEVEFSILRVLETVFREPIVIIGSVGFMLMVSPQLTVFVFILIAFTGIVIGGVSRSLRKQSRGAQDLLANLISIVEESLGGMRIIRAFNAEGLQQKRFDKENEEYRSLLTRILWRRDLASPLSEWLGITVVVTLLWFGSKQVFSGQLTPETFFAFLFAFYNVINPAKAFSNAYYNIQKGLASADRINEILAVANPVANAPDAVVLDDFNSSIVFENVSFRYPGTDVDVLKDINITIGKGEIIALVGSSGSGKSTLADLIPRFHDPVQGRILIDGMDLRQVQVESLRDNMGIVTQEAILFNDTIDMNIRFSTDATQAEVEKAARYANAHDFIMETEEGYQTIVGERGTRLSGGQRQRITIARALVKNPPILILDEATAALDSESERLVQEALDHVMQGRTSVIIAHRLSTIRHADRIFVMKEGRIVETGTHEQLQSLDGEYRKFIELQAF